MQASTLALIQQNVRGVHMYSFSRFCAPDGASEHGCGRPGLQPHSHARGAGINDFPNASLADVAAALPVLRAYGVPLVVHAELDDGTPAQARPP